MLTKVAHLVVIRVVPIHGDEDRATSSSLDAPPSKPRVESDKKVDKGKSSRSSAIDIQRDVPPEINDRTPSSDDESTETVKRAATSAERFSMKAYEFQGGTGFRFEVPGTGGGVC